jgi:hypothetical protein
MKEVITIGIDAHTQVHVAAVVDAHGRVIDTLSVGADRGELARMLSWIQGTPGPRQVAVEGAKGFGRVLTLVLLHAGEEKLDVPTHLTAQGRRHSRRRGKDDEGDALIIARVAIQEPSLPRKGGAPEHGLARRSVGHLGGQSSVELPLPDLPYPPLFFRREQHLDGLHHPPERRRQAVGPPEALVYFGVPVWSRTNHTLPTFWPVTSPGLASLAQ